MLYDAVLLRTDPITGREIAKPCWNTLHEDPLVSDAKTDCKVSLCQCMCHDYDPLATRKIHTVVEADAPQA